MTVSTTSYQASVAATNTVGQEIPFTFPITATSDIVVRKRLILTPFTITTLTETTDYTVALNGDGSTGGTVTLVLAIAATYNVHVIRDTILTQAMDLVNLGTYNAETIEAAADKLTKISIELDDGVKRSLRAPDTDTAGTDLELPTAGERALKYLYFDATGEPTAVTVTTPVAAITLGAFGITMGLTATAAAARTALVLVPGTNVQTYSADLLAIAALAKTANNFIMANGTAWTLVTASLALTGLGFTAFTKTLIDDTTATAARATLGVPAADDIEVWEGDVQTWEDNVETWNI